MAIGHEAEPRARYSRIAQWAELYFITLSHSGSARFTVQLACAEWHRAAGIAKL